MTLSRTQVAGLKPVKTFLEMKSLNSSNTSRAYLSALVHFNNLLSPNHTVETILEFLLQKKMDVYELLNPFIAYLSDNVSRKTATLYLAAVISYFGFRDIDIIPAKFKKRVTVPKLYKKPEQAIDAKDIRKILLACTGAGNRRLKAYLLLLASGGMREVEGPAIRHEDIDFTVNPTTIHFRPEYAKTGVARDRYISDEATEALKALINWKNETKKPTAKDDLVFQLRRRRNGSPEPLYRNIANEFSTLRKAAGFAERKDNSRRHKITLQSFRRFVKTTISNSAGKEYSEWFIGHADSPYYRRRNARTLYYQMYETSYIPRLHFP